MKPTKIHLTPEELDNRLVKAYNQGKADGVKVTMEKYNFQNTLLRAVDAQTTAMEALTKLVQSLKQ